MAILSSFSRAISTLTFTGAAANGNTITIGTTTYQVYTFVTTLSDVSGKIARGASIDHAINRLVAAINGVADPNVAASTPVNAFVTAERVGNAIVITAKDPGVAGLTVITLSGMLNASWPAGTMEGGVGSFDVARAEISAYLAADEAELVVDEGATQELTDDLDEAASDLTDDVMDTDELVTEMDAELAGFEGEITSLSDEVAGIQTEVTDLVAEVIGLEAELVKMDADVARLDDDADEAVAGMPFSVPAGLQDQRKHVRDRIKATQARLQVDRQDMEALKGIIYVTGIDLTDLKVRLEDKRDLLQTRRGTIDTKNVRLAAVKVRLDARHGQVLTARGKSLIAGSRVTDAKTRGQALKAELDAV